MRSPSGVKMFLWCLKIFLRWRCTNTSAPGCTSLPVQDGWWRLQDTRLWQVARGKGQEALLTVRWADRARGAVDPRCPGSSRCRLPLGGARTPTGRHGSRQSNVWAGPWSAAACALCNHGTSHSSHTSVGLKPHQDWGTVSQGNCARSPCGGSLAGRAVQLQILYARLQVAHGASIGRGLGSQVPVAHKHPTRLAQGSLLASD